MRISRAAPLASASAAARRTAPCTQPPPRWPMISPASVTAALAPALAEVTSAVRTTVATQKGRPSGAQPGDLVEDVEVPWASEPGELGLECGERLSVFAGRCASRCGSAAAIPAATGA
jgi:hypothetical protein